MNKLNIVLPFNSKLCGASSSWFLQRFSDWYMHLEFDFNENLLMWVRASNYIAVKKLWANTRADFCWFKTLQNEISSINLNGCVQLNGSFWAFLKEDCNKLSPTFQFLCL